MQRELLKTVILEWQVSKNITPDVDRDLPTDLSVAMHSESIVIITGVRRCGKSILLQHIRRKNKEQHYYINFEDERLIQFTVEDFQMMMEVFIELYGEEKICYFDEIQNILGWERFVRRLYEQGYKIFITGSNAKMLSRELGTHLSGRHIRIELYPFSFSEFLKFKNITVNLKKKTTVAIANLNRAMHHYVKIGGFPQYVKEEMLEYLQSLYDSILYRDIIARYQLPNEQSIKELTFYFSSNIGKLVTYNSLRQYLHLSAVNTVSAYCQYLENCYLFFLVKRFHASLKVQMNSPKKVYAIDTGLAYVIGFRSSADAGRMLENIVFLELKRKQFDIYYHHEKKECDFVVCKQNAVCELIQVCWDLSDAQTKQRELDGLMDAMIYHQKYHGTIVTLTESDEFSLDVNEKKATVRVVPIWQWLLE